MARLLRTFTCDSCDGTYEDHDEPFLNWDLVACGHTHGEGHCEIRPNLEVFTGGAEYYNPKLQRVIERV